MKKSISILLCIVMIFSSFSFCFATATSWDTSDQANLQYIRNSLTTSTGTVVSALNSIISNTNTIANHLNTIKGYLIDGGYSITYWVHAISSWMNPIFNAITNVPVDLSTIIGALGFNDSNNVYHPYLNDISKGVSNYYLSTTPHTRDQALNNSHTSFLYNYDGTFRLRSLDTTNYAALWSQFNWYSGSPIGNIALILKTFNDNTMTSLEGVVYGAKNQQTYTEWDTLNSSSFTPNSLSNGLYTWLSKIQSPAARLSYVLASDQRIEAQELAADNEQAVVDNFIDSTGSGAASTSDFDSIADFSSGYKSTFASDASPTGIFDIFNSNNMGWFSQETANQLDTTSNNRAKSDNTFNTPLLDQQIDSIYEQLGVKQP